MFPDPARLKEVDVSASAIDLHVHTTASDGSLSPEQLIVRANALGIRILSITDHDTMAGFEPALRATRQYGIQLIPGIEITSDDDGQSVHFLGYYIEPSSSILLAELDRQRAERTKRAQVLVERLAADGYAISWEHVQANSAGQVVSRSHIARALIKAGYATSVSDAFARLIGPGAPYFMPRPNKLDPAAAIRLIRQAGGVAILAHPVSMPSASPLSSFPLSRLERYVPAGLQGLEVYYAGYPHETTDGLVQIAHRHGLIMTGGSDFHGLAKPGYELGGVYVPTCVVQALGEACKTGANIACHRS